MKNPKQIFMVLCCIFFTVSTFATSVTQDNATRVAKNYFSEVLLSHGKNFTAEISESFEINKDGNAVLYVFNFEKGGYVIVSAEDRFTPILGYSPNGYYDPNNMPDGFEFLMEKFSKMITFIREENILGEPQYTAKWERYQSDNHIPERGAATVVVAPMTALWNQDSPYNYYAPAVFTGGSGGRAYAGCVATAMSIIMYYWRWPWQGIGSETYEQYPCNDQHMPIQYANFGQTFYDYNGMYGTPTLNADNVLYKPIALLQHHAGIAVNMHYCGNGSGAYSFDVPVAMKAFFKYHKNIEQVERDYYTFETWTQMMKGQLNLRQPVYVSGYSQSSGHAFVCDGYDSDNMFHYNFGWSGNSNGYFIVDKPLNFIYDVDAIINFIPDPAQGYPVDCNNTWTIPHLKGTIADCSGPAKNYTAGITAKWLIDPSVEEHVVTKITINAIEMGLASGDFLRIYDGENESAPLLGEFSGNNLFETLTSTGGKVLVKFTSSNSSATAPGFMISYDAELFQCCDPRKPITLTEMHGILTDGCLEDMNYYNITGPCKWIINPKDADDNTEITLWFNFLDVKTGASLKLIDMDKNKLIANIFETSGELPKFTLHTKKLQVSFTSNSDVTGKGFEIEYIVSPVSILEQENINNLFIYPNPVIDKLFVKFNAEVTDDYNINIYNVMGQVVYHETLHNFMGEYDNTFNLNNFAQGVYMLQIKSSKGIITRKVVK